MFSQHKHEGNMRIKLFLDWSVSTLAFYEEIYAD